MDIGLGVDVDSDRRSTMRRTLVRSSDADWDRELMIVSYIVFVKYSSVILDEIRYRYRIRTRSDIDIELDYKSRIIISISLELFDH
jgi:hypothetical protein